MNLEKIKKYFLRISILGAYGVFGIIFQMLLIWCVNYLQFTDFEKFLFLSIFVGAEAVFFISLYDSIKKDLFGIEKYKKDNMFPTGRIYKTFNYVKSIRNKFLLVIVYPLCFLLIALVVGPVITTILFRKNGPYPGFLSRETLVYFTPACAVSITTKYFGFAKLPMIVCELVKTLYYKLPEMVAFLMAHFFYLSKQGFRCIVPLILCAPITTILHTYTCTLTTPSWTG